MSASQVCGYCHEQKSATEFRPLGARTNVHGQWCRVCRRAHPERSVSLDVAWNGGYPPQVSRPYQVVCLQAGHVMRRVRLTEFQAARIVILGFKTRCGDCGGWLMLESDEDGQIGGGIQAHAVTGGHWWPESAA